MYKKILVLPGWMTELKLFEPDADLDVQFGRLNSKDNDLCIIGLSLGALAALRDWEGQGKLILASPPMPRKSLAHWFARWVKYIRTEGLFLERQKFTTNPFEYIIETVRCANLLRIDFSEKLDSLPKDRLVMVRAENDHFFCDEESVQFMRSKGIEVIEAENCGHNWSPEIERLLMDFVKQLVKQQKRL